MMTPMIRAMESTTIPTISPILSPPVSLACCVSAVMVVTGVVVVVAAVKKLWEMMPWMWFIFPKHSGTPNLILI